MWSYYIDSMNCVQAAVEQNDQIINFEYFLFGLFISFHFFLLLFFRSFVRFVLLFSLSQSLSLSPLICPNGNFQFMYTTYTRFISHFSYKAGWLDGWRLFVIMPFTMRWAMSKNGTEYKYCFSNWMCQLYIQFTIYNLQFTIIKLLCILCVHGVSMNWNTARQLRGWWMVAERKGHTILKWIIKRVYL